MQTETQAGADAPEFSILIGLVSTEDSERVLEALDALRNQQGAHSYEVIIADRRHDDVSSRLDADYPEVKRLPCPPRMSLPELRTLALDQASGTYIIVTEDHNVPSENWLASMAQAFADAPEGTVAVGGCVENGVYDTPLDWATFLCEYSYFLESVDEGDTTVLPGMNVAYHHSIFKHLDRELLTSGFWETTVHPVLLEKGLKLFSTNKIRLYHCKKFSFGLFARQRFIYSRYYAGLRFGRGQLLKRVAACGATLLLPPLLLYRSSKQIKAKNRLASEFRSAMPYLLMFYVIWAYGEMVGYILGNGDALARIE
jgi:glycosyltransferase involved in cell wall biosynthesis